MSPSGILGYHEASKHSGQSVRRSSRGLDLANKPFPYKDYPQGLSGIDLPMPGAPLPVSALDAVAGLGPSSPRELDAGELGRILNYGAGVMRKLPVSETQAMYFRTTRRLAACTPSRSMPSRATFPGWGPACITTIPAGVPSWPCERRITVGRSSRRLPPRRR